MMKLDAKKAIVDEVAKVAKTALSVAAADYRGLTVGQMNDLRQKARSQGVYLRVVRNTLAQRAVVGTEFECLKGQLTGPLILAFSKEEPGSAARVFRDFSKQCEKFKVKMLAIGGKALGADQLDVVAKLPTRKEGLSILVSFMKQPIQQLTRTIAEPQAKLVRTLAAIRDQKQAA